MPLSPRIDRAVRYACAVAADFGLSRLPVDPFALAENSGITVLPLSSLGEAGWIPWDLSPLLQMTAAVTVTYPAFCIVYRDDLSDPARLRYALCHELGHLFMNHYRDYPGYYNPGKPWDAGLEAEADAFARNLLAPVPVVDVIRFNRPGQAKAQVFGLPRSAWMNRLDSLAEDREYVDEDMANTLIYLFHDYLLGRRCAACGHVFTDKKQDDRCPRCGADHPDWDL